MIIKKLQLKVHFIKVKAHSGNAYNDIADAQAKIGRLNRIPTNIQYRHLNHQTVTLIWNEQIPIDRDVRKCLGTISNFKKLEDHLNHSSLKEIKKATFNNIINWSITSKWLNFNGRDSQQVHNTLKTLRGR